jgi:hypothetical protein
MRHDAEGLIFFMILIIVFMLSVAMLSVVGPLKYIIQHKYI